MDWQNHGIKLTIPADKNVSFSIAPKLSAWQAELVPGVIFRPLEGTEPNRFHRWMQRIAFGIKWKKGATP